MSNTIKMPDIEPNTEYKCIDCTSPFIFNVGEVYKTNSVGRFVVEPEDGFFNRTYKGDSATWEKVEDLKVGDFVARFENGYAVYYGVVTKVGNFVHIDTIRNYDGTILTQKREVRAPRSWWTKIELTPEQAANHFPWLDFSETETVESDNGYYNSVGRFVSDLKSSAPCDRKKIASDGGSTDYYKIPEHATELRHIISAKGMSKARGDIFKACYRLGEKEGVDVGYDLNKMKFFIEDLIEMHKRGEHL